MEQTTNKIGVRINKCCASCEHKTYSGSRLKCGLAKFFVAPDDVCGKWNMHPCFEKVGVITYGVKKKDYLMEVVKEGGMSRAEYENRKGCIWEIRP